LRTGTQEPEKKNRTIEIRRRRDELQCIGNDQELSTEEISFDAEKLVNGVFECVGDRAKPAVRPAVSGMLLREDGTTIPPQRTERCAGVDK
jgi:hypothetical protein